MTQEQIEKYEALKNAHNEISTFIKVIFNPREIGSNALWNKPSLPKKHADFIKEYLESEAEKIKKEIETI